MARDYKHHSRKATTRARQAPGAPNWVWMVTGLALGLGVALGVHLHHSRAADMQRVIADSIAPDPSPADTTRKPKFEFYETLPNAMKNVMADGTTHAAPRVAPRQGTQYFIQAGAFRRANEADRLRAELALLGLEAQVKRSRDWHKVRLGPFRDLSALSAVKKRLPAASKPMVYEIKI